LKQLRSRSNVTACRNAQREPTAGEPNAKPGWPCQTLLTQGKRMSPCGTEIPHGLAETAIAGKQHRATHTCSNAALSNKRQRADRSKPPLIWTKNSCLTSSLSVESLWQELREARASHIHISGGCSNRRDDIHWKRAAFELQNRAVACLCIAFDHG
jgi:hypothetical protein